MNSKGQKCIFQPVQKNTPNKQKTNDVKKTETNEEE